MKQTRNLIILSIVAIVIVIWATVAYRNQMSAGPVAGKQALGLGENFFPELDAKFDQVDSIRVWDKNTSRTLVKNEDGQWSVDIGPGYPAKGDEVRRLIMDLLDLKALDAITSNEERYAHLGVETEAPADIAVEVFDASGKALAGFIRGDQRETEAAPAMGMPTAGGGVYMRRLPDDPWVYLADDEMAWATPDITNWIDSTINTYDAEADVQNLTIDHASTATLVFADRDGKWTLTNELADDMQAKTTEVNAARRALRNIRIQNVQAASEQELASMDFATTATARLKSGAVYRAEVADLGYSKWVRLSAALVDPMLPAGDDVSTETLAAAREAAEAAKTDVPAFNEQHAPWLYRVSDYTADQISPALSDVTEPKPEPKPEADTEAGEEE